MSKFFKCFAMLVFLAGCEAKDENLSQMVITTADGDVIYMVETANTQEEMSQGLMNRKQLRADSGMIFDINGAQGISMWMKDTYIPLDMLFVNQKGEIVWIYGNATPLSTTLIKPDVTEPLAAVIEINAGDVQKHNIKVGDTVKHEVIK
ncbi:MAG: DUF192 domain-containing protein [Alphaproteobacteria bacterium]|nr:DUF192 domain-containing protein [Alphaproteobacteria bacterium]